VLIPEPRIMCQFSATQRTVPRTAKLVATRAYNTWLFSSQKSLRKYTP
jgi:hypothetical protein